MEAVLAHRRPGRRACRRTDDLYKYVEEIGARVKGRWRKG